MRLLLLRCAGLATLAACAHASSVAGDPSDAVREAAQMAGAGSYDDAIARLRGVLASDARRLDAMRTLVEVHHKAGRLSALKEELRRRVEASDADDVAHYGLGLASFATAAHASDEAVDHLRRAATLRPDQAEYHFRLGVALLEAERYEDALPCFRRAAELEPQQAKPLVPYAMCLARSGDRKGAIAAMARLVELEPDARDVELAQRVMRRLTDPLRELPKGVEQEVERGIALLERSDAPQPALVVFSEILEKYPDLAAVHALVGLCHHRLDNAGAAVDAYRRAMELAPDDARTYVYLGDVYFARERYDLAREAFEKAVERDPLDEAAYRRLGEIAANRSDAAEAVKRFRVLVRLLRNDPAARLAYAKALAAAADAPGAEREFSAVVTLDPKNIEAHLRLALLYDERLRVLQDARERASLCLRASKTYERVLDLQPQNLVAANRLKQLKAVCR